MIKKLLFLLFINFYSYSQSLNLNNPIFENELRRAQLNGEIDPNISFNLRPIEINQHNFNKKIINVDKYAPTILSFLNNKAKVKILPIDFNINYSSRHPYNRNNGSMIPSRGYQQLVSAGLYFEIGPLTIQLKPENIYAENKDYLGFWEGHWDVIWARRYKLWNRIDLPERFGDHPYKKTTFGQSSIRLNYKALSIGISSENIWWGPSIRNGIMMSNNAQGFNHITFNTRKPIKTSIGSFEFQLLTGRLESSGYNPPNIDRTYAGTKIFVPKTNKNGLEDDWRFFQGYSFNYSPKWISGFHFGIIRWVQMYGAMFEGKYNWIAEANNGATVGWFPIFNNFLRKYDTIDAYEWNTDQAASGFFRWVWEDSKAEVYGEFGYNDSKVSLRDLLLDSDHSRAVTLGIHKLFDSKNKKSQFEFKWEWTQMEQTGSRLVRNAGSWYMHSEVRHGYTNNGEVIGAGIGPGSNSQYFSFARLKQNERIGGALEIIDHDNDFYYMAWEDNGDFNRYWKDYNLHLFFEKEFKNFWGSLNFIYSKNLNYQWELYNNPEHPFIFSGVDVENFHIDLKITIPIKL